MHILILQSCVPELDDCVDIFVAAEIVVADEDIENVDAMEISEGGFLCVDS